MYADNPLALALPTAAAQRSDETTLATRLASNPDAFTDLYEVYLERVYRYLRTRTTSDEEAADLTQQVFLQAFAALPRFRSHNVPAGAWLFRIARNVAVDAHRRRHATVDWDHLPEALQTADDSGVEAQVLGREAAERLRGLLQTLDETKREALILRFVAELSIREIADVLGKKPKAVQKQLARTLESLKEQYDVQ